MSIDAYRIAERVWPYKAIAWLVVLCLAVGVWYLLPSKKYETVQWKMGLDYPKSRTWFGLRVQEAVFESYEMDCAKLHDEIANMLTEVYTKTEISMEDYTRTLVRGAVFNAMSYDRHQRRIC